MDSTPTPTPRKRGRPPKRDATNEDARALLVRTGMEVMTEVGFTAAGLDRVLKQAQIPKGSFYYWFDSKEAFTLAVLDGYRAYFARRLQRTLHNAEADCQTRIRGFCDEAMAGLVRHEYRRGCLVGNLGQELNVLSPALREGLRATFRDWEQQLAICLQAGQAQGEIPGALQTARAASLFWNGWEGAMLRARLEHSLQPLQDFRDAFITSIFHSNSPPQECPR